MNNDNESRVDVTGTMDGSEVVVIKKVTLGAGDRVYAGTVDNDDGHYAFVGHFSSEAEALRVTRKWLCEEAGGNEMSCPIPLRDCHNCKASAAAAGIPMSVIEGKTKLSDHFTKETIDRECGREPKQDE